MEWSTSKPVQSRVRAARPTRCNSSVMKKGGRDGLSHLYDRATGYAFAYDFFEKDHLGNTRTHPTQELSIRPTTSASFEQHYRTLESHLFGNIARTCVARTTKPNNLSNPNNLRFGEWSPNDSGSKVDYNGTSGQTTGVNLLLKHGGW